jgi:hypothetical protein
MGKEERKPRRRTFFVYPGSHAMVNIIMQSVISHNSFHIPASPVEELPGQDLLAACDPRFLTVVEAGLSAIAYAAQENPALLHLLHMGIFSELIPPVIHPDFTRQAKEVRSSAYLAQSGAAMLLVADSCQRCRLKCLMVTMNQLWKSSALLLAGWIKMFASLFAKPPSWP